MATRKKTVKKQTNKDILLSIKTDLQEIKERLTSLESAETKDILEEEEIAKEEREQLKELDKLEELEEEIRNEVRPKPLQKITYHDISKGIIGAFFGIVGHFAFFYGEKLAHDLTIMRAHGLILTSIFLLILFIYFSGFRAVTPSSKFWFIPLRVIVIFLTAQFVVVFVLLLFGRISFSMSLVDIYKNIAAVSILAVMGAATADLIGRE